MPLDLGELDPSRIAMSPSKEQGGPGFAVPNVPDENDENKDIVYKTVTAGADGVNSRLPSSDYPSSTDVIGSWPANQSPQLVTFAQLTDGHNPPFPYNRVLTSWGKDKYSDESLRQFVFEGIGQHRVEPARADNTIPGAVHAVYLGFAEALDVKPGLAKYGADAYFSEGNVLGIRRNGELFTPDSPPLQWAAAKGAFRGTLAFVITAWDHLARLHLSLSNGMATANANHLPVNHPVRLLLAAHTYERIEGG